MNRLKQWVLKRFFRPEMDRIYQAGWAEGFNACWVSDEMDKVFLSAKLTMPMPEVFRVH